VFWFCEQIVFDILLIIGKAQSDITTKAQSDITTKAQSDITTKAQSDITTNALRSSCTISDRLVRF